MSTSHAFLSTHRKSTFHRPSNEWTIVWEPIMNDGLYLKTIEHNDPFSIIWHAEPSKKSQPVLVPCPGCQKHTRIYRDLRPRCVLVFRTQDFTSIHRNTCLPMLPTSNITFTQSKHQNTSVQRIQISDNCSLYLPFSYHFGKR